MCVCVCVCVCVYVCVCVGGGGVVHVYMSACVYVSARLHEWRVRRSVCACVTVCVSAFIVMCFFSIPQTTLLRLKILISG